MKQEDSDHLDLLSEHDLNIIVVGCPKCHAVLELDAGFAGGVARCHACQAMVLVPDDPTPHANALLEGSTPPVSSRLWLYWLVLGGVIAIAAAAVFTLFWIMQSSTGA